MAKTEAEIKQCFVTFSCHVDELSRHFTTHNIGYGSNKNTKEQDKCIKRLLIFNLAPST